MCSGGAVAVDVFGLFDLVESQEAEKLRTGVGSWQLEAGV